LWLYLIIMANTKGKLKTLLATAISSIILQLRTAYSKTSQVWQ